MSRLSCRFVFFPRHTFNPFTSPQRISGPKGSTHFSLGARLAFRSSSFRSAPTPRQPRQNKLSRTVFAIHTLTPPKAGIRSCCTKSDRRNDRMHLARTAPASVTNTMRQHVQYLSRTSASRILRKAFAMDASTPTRSKANSFLSFLPESATLRSSLRATRCA